MTIKLTHVDFAMKNDPKKGQVSEYTVYAIQKRILIPTYFPLVSSGVLELRRQNEPRRLGKNVKIFIQKFKGVFNHFSLHPREMTPSRGGPVLHTVRGVPATR